VIDIETDNQYGNFSAFRSYFDYCYTMGSRLYQAQQANWSNNRIWVADYGNQTYTGEEDKYSQCLAWQYTSVPYDKSVIYSEAASNSTTTTGDDEEMEFLFKAENGKDIYYHVAGKTVKVENPDYLTAIKAVYQQLNNKELKTFDWTNNATSKVFINQFK